MAKDKKTRKPGSGGPRPGAGRPLTGTAPRVTKTIRLSPEAVADFDWLRSRGVDMGVIIERGIRSFAVLHREGRIPSFDEFAESE